MFGYSASPSNKGVVCGKQSSTYWRLCQGLLFGLFLPSFEDALQIVPSVRAEGCGDFFGGPFGDDLPAGGTPFGAEVDNVIGALQDIEVVLDNDDCIAALNELLQNVDEFSNVVIVQPHRRLIEEKI